jgi:hypothetical protein
LSPPPAEELSAPAPASGSRWERHFFAPVAAVRPRLLQRGVLLLLAFDAWWLRVPYGSRYGADGLDVAHWGWLGALQPLPRPSLYVGLMLAVGLAAVTAVFLPARRLLALLALGWTWGWAMSLIDSLQHHYFLSLVLGAFVFFPGARAAAGPAGATLALGAPQGGAANRVTAWAYVALSANVAIVYAFSAISKLDAAWRSGLTLQRVRGVKAIVLPLASWLGERGLAQESFWRILASGTLVLEMAIAIGYAAAPWLDRTGRSAGGGTRTWVRRIGWAALGAAVLLHTGAELLRLRIGWFSGYMLLFAAVHFLPARWLEGAERAFAAPSGWWSRFSSGKQGPVRKRRALLLAAVAAAGTSGMAGFAMDLPGAPAVGIASVGAIGIAAMLFAGWESARAGRFVGALGFAIVLQWAAVSFSSVRERYYLDAARDLRLRGPIAAARLAEEKARRYRMAWSDVERDSPLGERSSP